MSDLLLWSLLRTSQLYKDANITIDDSESDVFSGIVDADNETTIMPLFDEQTFDKNEVLSVAPGERENT